MLESNAATAALRTWLVTGGLPPVAPAQAEALVDAARDQGLTGLLAAVDPHWPDAARRRLRDGQRLALAETVQKLALARRVLDLLAARGLRALPLKGAAVAESLYDSPAERPMEDVDVLVLDDWGAAVGALGAAGFQERERADHAWCFVDPVTSGALELHRGLTSCPRLHPVDVDALWRRRQTSDGLVGLRPGAADLLAQLSLHAAFQHGLVLRLGQYLDVRRLLERTPPGDDDALAVARDLGAERAVAATLEVAARVTGAPVSADLRAAFASFLTPSLARALARQPLAFVAPAPPRLARLRWELSAGRRRRLLAATLGLDHEASFLQRGAHGLRRAGALLRRWGAPAVRNAVATAWARGVRR